MTTRERFFAKARIIESGCWIWTGSINASGYGTFHAGKRTWLAHRWSYESIGKQKPCAELHHLCRVKTCVNWQHVVPVKPNEHPDKPSVFNKFKEFCPQGHPYSGANLYVDRIGHRHCRICRKEAGKRSYSKNWHKAREQQRAYYQRNKNKINERKRRTYFPGK